MPTPYYFLFPYINSIFYPEIFLTPGFYFLRSLADILKFTSDMPPLNANEATTVIRTMSPGFSNTVSSFADESSFFNGAEYFAYDDKVVDEGMLFNRRPGSLSQENFVRYQSSKPRTQIRPAVRRVPEGSPGSNSAQATPLHARFPRANEARGSNQISSAELQKRGAESKSAHQLPLEQQDDGGEDKASGDDRF